MEQSLASTTQFSFSNDLLEQLVAETQEDTQALQAALKRAVPVAVQALAGRVAGPNGPATIWKLGREAYGANVLEPMAAENHAVWIDRGQALMQGLLGETYHFTAMRVATAANVGMPAAERVLSASAVAALGVIGEHSQEQNLTPETMAVWLTQEGGQLTSQLIPEPHATTTPELSAPATVPVPGSWEPVGGGQTYMPPRPAANPQSSIRWQWGALLLVAVVLGYWFGNWRSQPGGINPVVAAVTAVPASTSAADTRAGRYDATTGNYIYDTGQPLILHLANGTTQKVGATSTENRLYTFLADPTQQVDSVNRTKGWINFDRVYFEPSSTTLTDESFLQLRNVAGILQTFPASVVKIGGYTDSTGNPLKNFQLSEERAKTAMLAMAGMGIDMNRIQAKGYGGKYFITPNTTPEGRALNRRISIRVLKK
ncbi:OmpA family protein [Hymenobacter endophyticus]|uniref:OmpA family protein n=1 Tax=Hymenobacter endophyticus TaxID=3076335 RepID=A0ABU3TMF7_9BACT|nr:OmpA family protein [Hymenobacter endophyticus]MDU0372571.1 OmpA family protein [Hymenobacter endophyticus]